MEIPSLIQILIAIALFILTYSIIEELSLTGFESSKYLSGKVFWSGLAAAIVGFGQLGTSIREDSSAAFFFGALIGIIVFMTYLGLLAKLGIIKSKS